MSSEIGHTRKNANIELLRIISMVMIIFLHALGKGNLLTDMSKNPSINGYIAWVIESLSISAVNIFMLISGYFLIDSKFKIKRVIELALETVFYSLGAFLVCIAFGVDTGEEINTYFILHTILPVHMNLYWFVTSYIVIYMLQPLISAGVKNITKKQYEIMLIVLISYESIFKSVLPVRLNEDQSGYNVLWFLIVFLIGAYFKLYGFKYIYSVRRGFAVYILASFFVFLETQLINLVITKTNHLKEIEEISFEYNHLFVLMASVGIFAAFLSMKPMKEQVGKTICMLSPMALGVYLFHENLSLRYNWQKWLGIYDSLNKSTPEFLAGLFVAVLIVYLLGSAVDFLRIRIFKLLRL